MMHHSDLTNLTRTWRDLKPRNNDANLERIGMLLMLLSCASVLALGAYLLNH